MLAGGTGLVTAKYNYCTVLNTDIIRIAAMISFL